MQRVLSDERWTKGERESGCLGGEAKNRRRCVRCQRKKGDELSSGDSKEDGSVASLGAIQTQTGVVANAQWCRNGTRLGCRYRNGRGMVDRSCPGRCNVDKGGEIST